MNKLWTSIFVGLFAVGVATFCPGCKPDLKTTLESGIASVNSGEFDKAIAAFTEVLRHQPTNGWIYGYRGRAYFSQGHLDQALSDFNQAVRFTPNDPRAYTSRAYTLYGKGDYTQALKDLEHVLRLTPNDFHAYPPVAWLLATCPSPSIRDGSRAVTLATKGCELSAWKEWQCIGTLAAACAEAGDFQRAVKHQNQALALGTMTPQETALAKARLQLYQRREPYHQEPQRR